MTFPGHQETSARIIRVLKRMKPKESSIEPQQDQAGALIGGVERLAAVDLEADAA